MIFFHWHQQEKYQGNIEGGYQCGPWQSNTISRREAVINGGSKVPGSAYRP